MLSLYSDKSPRGNEVCCCVTLCWEKKSTMAPKHLCTFSLGMLKMQGPDHFLPGQFLKVVFAETTCEACGNISFQTKSRFASAFYKSVELSKLNVTPVT